MKVSSLKKIITTKPTIMKFILRLSGSRIYPRFWYNYSKSIIWLLMESRWLIRYSINSATWKYSFKTYSTKTQTFRPLSSTSWSQSSSSTLCRHSMQNSGTTLNKGKRMNKNLKVIPPSLVCVRCYRF